VLRKINQISAIKSCSNHSRDLLHGISEKSAELFILTNLSSGDFFYFPTEPAKQGELYIKIKNLRSNALCIRVSNNKRYTIHAMVQVELFPIKE
jgi:hypothetical protein